jgi:hypothetical protein
LNDARSKSAGPLSTLSGRNTPAWFARPIAPRCSGANRADWVGRGALGGVLYDLTTNNPAEIAKHLARFYGERMRVVTYVPPW